MAKDSYALIKIESPNLTLWNLLRKYNVRWEIVTWEENIEKLSVSYEEIYQKSFSKQVTELLQRLEATMIQLEAEGSAALRVTFLILPFVTNL